MPPDVPTNRGRAEGASARWMAAPAPAAYTLLARTHKPLPDAIPAPPNPAA